MKIEWLFADLTAIGYVPRYVEQKVQFFWYL